MVSERSGRMAKITKLERAMSQLPTRKKWSHMPVSPKKVND